MAIDKDSELCVVCGVQVDIHKAFAFNFNDEFYFFCDSHSIPFKMGLSLGQLEINGKFISYISGLPDPISKSELRKNLLQLTPYTKINSSTDSLIDQPSQAEIEFSINNPKDLFEELSKTVIGQDIAKKAVSVAVINHLQTVNDEHIGQNTHSDKHHVLLLGKSGSGKTLIANTVANAFELPFTSGDATNYSPTGFQGADADSVVYDLLLETDMNFELAEKGVVFIDEIDKICCSNKNSGKYESFIGSTQSTLLKLIEGKIVKVPGQMFGEAPGSSFNIDTSGMLFFFGGAFNGLADIVAKKMGQKDKVLGFRKDSNYEKNKEIDEALRSYEIFARASREELVESLIEFGMLSELVGRIPTIVPLKPLSKEDLLKVLMESDASPILRQKKSFMKSGFNIEFTEDFLKKVVDLSYSSATGTRALDSYVKKAVSFASFDLLNLTKNNLISGKVIISDKCLDDPSSYEKILIAQSNSISTSINI